MKHVIRHHTTGYFISVRLSESARTWPLQISPNRQDAFQYDDRDDAERERALLLSFAPAWESRPVPST
jgi:hypothetical protein